MTEARAWRTIGISSMAGALLLIAIQVAKSGVRIDSRIWLASDLGAAFIGMAGAVACISGRFMAVAQSGQHADSAGRLSRVGCGLGVVGALIVMAAVYRSFQTHDQLPTLSQMWLGTAGSSVLLTGIVCFLAGRVLTSMASAAPAAAAGAAAGK